MKNATIVDKKRVPFVLPEGVQLADAESEKNLRSVWKHGRSKAGVFYPMVLILGACASGKTTLLRALLEHYYGSAGMSPEPRTERAFGLALLDGLSSGYAAFDNAGKKLLNWPVLHQFLSCKSFGVRKQHVAEAVVFFPKDVRIFVTAHADSPLSPALMRRNPLIIRLKPFDPAMCGVKVRGEWRGRRVHGEDFEFRGGILVGNPPPEDFLIIAREMLRSIRDYPDRWNALRVAAFLNLNFAMKKGAE